LALNLIGSWGRAATIAVRSLVAWKGEHFMERRYDVQMRALITFSGDMEEGVHSADSVFFTTESRAAKYERSLPRLAIRLAKVSVSSGTVKRRPAVRPEETKATRKKVAKKPVKKKAAKRKK
jgi:hypothetical protein